MHVSVCIPVHNCETWVGAAIESALGQTWPDKEVIVVDDGSTDGTERICRRYEENVTYVRQPKRGVSAARNHALILASGDWIQYLDADDYLLPNKLAAQLSIVRHDEWPDVIFSPHRMEVWEGDKRVSSGRTSVQHPSDPIYTWLTWEFFQIGGFLLRRDALNQIGGWDESLRTAEDDELWLRMVVAGWRWRFVPEPLAVWRQWSNQTASHAHANEDLVICHALIDRLQQALANQGRWNDYYQRLADQQRFGIARRLAVTDLATASARYAEECRGAFLQYPYASPSWRVRFAFRLFGFERAERLALAWRRAKALKPPM